MWLISNFLGYIITGIICSVILVFFSKKFKNFFYGLKIRSSLNSIRILEITNKQQCQEACWFLKSHCEDLSALGFDCEWVSVNKKQRPVALLQLATVHGLCCLFRLNILTEIPSELQELLLDSKIIKLGISSLNDSKLLMKDYNVQVCSTLDLRYLYPTGGGLASLSASEIGVKLDKSWWLKCSNWESPELTESQKHYAAKDAFVAMEIFKKWLMIKNKKFNLFGTKRNYIYLFNEEVKLEISRFLDVYFKPIYFSESSINSNKKTFVMQNNNNQNQKKLKSGYVTRKSPLYHNCFMHAPDGELLCSCDRRKAQWYVDRGLAEILPGEPYSIRLLFEPAARARETNGGRFYQQLKQNCCVVCGAVKSYLKHNVVPKEYRKHFPNIMKDHQSHDVVLMCLRCHHLAAQHNEILRKKLALTCNAPLTAVKVTQIRTIQKVRNSARALLKKGDFIPNERKTFLKNEIKKYYEAETLTSDLLEKAANSETKTINENYEAHGIKVVNYFMQKGGGLTKLEILWREHFLDTMKPQYLPALWSVTHNHSRLSVKAEKTSLTSVKQSLTL